MPDLRTTTRPPAPRTARDSQAPQDGQDSQAPQDGQDSQAPQDGQDSQAPQDGQDSQAPQDGEDSPDSKDSAQRRRAGVVLEAALEVLGQDSSRQAASRQDSSRQAASRQDSSRQDDPDDDPDGAAAMFGDPAGTGALILDLGDDQESPPAAPAALIMDLGDDQEDARTFMDEIEDAERDAATAGALTMDLSIGEEDAPRRPDTPVVVGVEGRSLMDEIEDAERDAQGPAQGRRPGSAAPVIDLSNLQDQTARPAAAQDVSTPLATPPSPKIPKRLNPSEAGRIMRARQLQGGRPRRPKTGNPIPRPKMPTAGAGGLDREAAPPQVVQAAPPAWPTRLDRPGRAGGAAVAAMHLDELRPVECPHPGREAVDQRRPAVVSLALRECFRQQLALDVF